MLRFIIVAILFFILSEDPWGFGRICSTAQAFP
jgi:hypothetical protein